MKWQRQCANVTLDLRSLKFNQFSSNVFWSYVSWWYMSWYSPRLGPLLLIFACGFSDDSLPGKSKKRILPRYLDWIVYRRPKNKPKSDPWLQISVASPRVDGGKDRQAILACKRTIGNKKLSSFPIESPNHDKEEFLPTN